MVVSVQSPICESRLLEFTVSLFSRLNGMKGGSSPDGDWGAWGIVEENTRLVFSGRAKPGASIQRLVPNRSVVGRVILLF